MEIEDRAYLSAAEIGECRPGRTSAFPVSFRNRLSVGLACVIVAILAGAGSAQAVVQVDPNGPAGQQYALPLDAIRGQVGGNPSAGVTGASVEEAPLFGVGIRPTGSRDSGRQGAGRGGDQGSRRSEEGAGNGSATDEDRAVKRAVTELTANPERESALPLVIIVGAMLILGIGAGWLGRRTL
jgi:hypothetical protein